MEIRADLKGLRPAIATCEVLSNAETVNPRPPGLHNDLIQLVKKVLARLLVGYIQPQREFNLLVVRSLDIVASSIEELQTNLQAMGRRLPQLEQDNAALMSTLQKCLDLLVKLESLANLQKSTGLDIALAGGDGQVSKLRAAPCVWLYDFDFNELRSAVAAIARDGNAVGTVNPRSSGWYNNLIQHLKKLMSRMLAWYTQALREFGLSVVRPLDILTSSIGRQRMDLQTMDERLPQLERDNATMASSLRQCMELLAKLESPAGSQKHIELEAALASTEGDLSKPLAVPCVWRYDTDELHSAVRAIEMYRNAMGAVSPRPSGWYNNLIQHLERLLHRSLAWYMRPLRDFNASVSRSLEEIACAVGNLFAVMVAFDRRLAQAEKRGATLAEAMQGQLALLHEQVKALVGLEEPANLEVPAGRMETGWDKRAPEISRLYIDSGLGNDRTTYVIGLFGSGRLYINMLMMENIGERAKYFRDGIRIHKGPTSMIYSGHATMRHIRRGQSLPVIMSRILESVRSGFADLIFVYRHPLDSLLTNWVFWRTYARENRPIWGVSQVYESTDALCAALEHNFAEFKAFAEGDPNFFAEPGARFLSFAEFVEETDLHLRAATLALRLEDFMLDPFREFCKIVEVMSLDPDAIHLPVDPPTTNPHRYLAVKEKAPQFRRFVDGLDAETKSRIEKMGYSLS